jgi:putative membrane protein (TIGR04086 family)
MPRLRGAAIGAGAALAVAFPVALLAQIADAVVEGDDAPWPVYLLVPVVLGAMVLGGWVAGRRAATRPWVDGALAGLLAIVVVLAIGAVRRAAADESVAWATVPATAVSAAVLGAAGGALAGRSPGRTRP